MENKNNKAITPKQLDGLKAEYKLGGDSVPPWVSKRNENTTRDLRTRNIYVIQDALDGALQTGKHSKQLGFIKLLANRVEIAQNIIAELKTGETKHRERVAHLMNNLELAISALENETGFDLYNKETWRDTPNN
jgi:hypothetical protein